jgi:molybdopterin converting factor small subunit
MGGRRMGVRINLPIFLQAFADNKETMDVQGQTVGECLAVVMEEHPGVRKMLVDDNGKLHSYVGIYINGQDAFPGEMTRPVKDGDEVHVLYALGGG